MDKEKDKKTHIKLYIFLIFIILFCFILLYSRYISTSVIKVKEYPIYTNKINNTIDGLKIIHISDILYGSTILDNGLEKLVNKINSLKPDIVIFTGDIVSNNYKLNSKSIKNITNSLKKIDAKYAKYAIRGDYDLKNDTFIEITDNANFKYLNNNYDLIYLSNSDYIYIGGIDSSNNIDYNIYSYDSTDIYKIILMHEPNNIDSVVKNIKPDLILAGHTLLGQVRLPFIGGISSNNDKPYYKIDNTQIYISPGIGTKDYPFRFMNNPTINFYRLIYKEL